MMGFPEAVFLDVLPGNWEAFHSWPIWRFLLQGLWLSVKIAGAGIFLSVLVGTVMAVARLAPIRGVRWLATTYIEVFRATPLLLLVLLVYFGAGRVDTHWILNVPGGGRIVDSQGSLQGIPSGVIALALYNSAVVAEILRAGILSISKGIIESSRAMGLTYLQSMRYVAVPMAFRRMAPGLVSQLITLFKDTSLLYLIGVVELLRSGRLIYDSPNYGNPIIEVLTVVAVMYFIPCYGLSLVARHLEQGPEQRVRQDAQIAAAPAAVPADMG